LDDHSERIRLSYPYKDVDPLSGDVDVLMVTADEVTYYDGGRWPSWADGQGASLELRDPDSDNDTPGAWADSDESGKAVWEQFSFTINGNDSRYRHDRVSIFDLLLLNRGEVLIDDLELIIDGTSRLNNDGFESGENNWRFLGNHVRSFVTTADRRSGARSLHMISTGHGDPGANRINQSISSVTAGTVTFRGWARWLKGTQFLLLRTSRERSPTQPPRPAHAFELTMPLDLGTPGKLNSAFVANRGPDIINVKHEPVIPASGEPIVVTARVTDKDGVAYATLLYHSEGSSVVRSIAMLDNGSGNDFVGGDGIYTAAIPGASNGTMRAFYIEATDGSQSTRFPTLLQPSADVPDRTCLVRVGDPQLNTSLATYRIWLSDDVISTFRSRPNLSNELMDCTFVYNNSEVFYNAGIRFRGSPFLRSGSGRDPRNRYAFRIDFGPDKKFRGLEEINLDNTEGGNRGPLQERATYWFHNKMGLQFSRQEYIRPIINGNAHSNYEDVQKIDGDYIREWFPNDTEGYIHKIDDYFEYTADGTGFSNLDEGLKSDSSHPRLKETYRWGFEKRSHRENDTWDHLLDFAAAFNTSSNGTLYEQNVESFIHPEQFARVLALRHAVGDWDSYGYRRGKNNYFYYTLPESKWYLLPWDIDFTLGSGDGANTNLFSVNSGQFPEVDQFINYPKYERMYLQALAELVNGPWQTSYGTSDPPTEFDKFLDDAADVLSANGQDAGRRNSIKRFVRDRRSYILMQLPSSLTFEITTNSGVDFFTSTSTVTIKGVAPIEVAGISVNGTSVPVEFSGNSVFEVDVDIADGPNLLNIQGLTGVGNPVTGAADSITVTRIIPCTVASVTPNQAYNDSTVQMTINGSGFEPGSATSVALTLLSDEIGFDALYVQSDQAFDLVDAATLLLDDPGRGVGGPINAVHEWINLWNTGGRGVFTSNEFRFAPPYQRGADNFAVRFTGYVFAPSGGTRYFGVSSDDGFSLWIDGRLVGEYADPHEAATTDVTQNRTDGTMAFDFPAAGSYYLILDYYENNGGEEIEFFQTNSAGADRRLINIDSELVVFRDNDTTIEATDIVIVDEGTITCRVDLAGAEPGLWNVVVTPQYGDTARCDFPGAIEIVSR
ncbi:MAG: CotH kinase family protein, partial [Planctomycetota bacterium]